MGASSSKTEVDEDRNANYIRRQIGKRSSINILKRAETRTTSTSTFHANPDTSQYDGTPQCMPGLDIKPAIHPGAALSTKSDKSDASTVVHRYSSKSLASRISSSSTSSGADEDAPEKEGPNECTNLVVENGRKAVIISATPTTSKTRQRKEPTRHQSWEPPQDEQSDDNKQTKRRTASGPELFRSARHLQKTLLYADDTTSLQKTLSTSPSLLLSTMIPDATISLIDPSPQKPYTPRQSNLSPVEVFRKARRQCHPHSSDSSDEPDGHVARLLRKPYPHNLFRDPDPSATPGRTTRIALALPIRPSQRECHRQHERFFATGQGTTPVECAICACAGDCVEDEDGDEFWTCEGCALRICAECEGTYQQHGVEALMARAKNASPESGSGSETESDGYSLALEEG